MFFIAKNCEQIPYYPTTLLVATSTGLVDFHFTEGRVTFYHTLAQIMSTLITIPEEQ